MAKYVPSEFHKYIKSLLYFMIFAVIVSINDKLKCLLLLLNCVVVVVSQKSYIIQACNVKVEFLVEVEEGVVKYCRLFSII